MLGGIWADNTYLHISDEYICDILALEITDRVTTLGDPVGETPHPINPRRSTTPVNRTLLTLYLPQL